MVQFWSPVTYVFLILKLAVWNFNMQILPESPYSWDSARTPQGSEASWRETFSLPAISTTSTDADVHGPCQEIARKYCLLLHTKNTLQAVLGHAVPLSLQKQLYPLFPFKTLSNVLRSSSVCVEGCLRKAETDGERGLWSLRKGRSERGWQQSPAEPSSRVRGSPDTHAADHRQTTLH